MGNAHPDVIAAASGRTVANNEDGVAVVIEQIWRRADHAAEPPAAPAGRPRGLRSPATASAGLDVDPVLAQPRHRIHAGPQLRRDPHLEVQVRAGRVAGRARLPDPLPGRAPARPGRR